MNYFTVKVRTPVSSTTYTAIATSSGDAYAAAAALFGDALCGITVRPGRSK